MKPLILLFSKTTVGLILLASTSEWLSAADLNTNSALAEAPKFVKSVFIMPTKPQEGCDPFFPNSTRPYAEATVTHHHSAAVSSLELKGISGNPPYRLVIVNNHTFAAGDEGDVVTREGRIHVRCIEIKPSSAILEADGQRVELSLPR